MASTFCYSSNFSMRRNQPFTIVEGRQPKAAMSQPHTIRESMVGGSNEIVITRACDMCRKKKIRCEPTSEKCIRCEKYKTPCHFTPVKVKRRPRRPIGQPRVDELEKRLKCMEEKLKFATQNRRHTETETESSLESMEIVRQNPSPMGHHPQYESYEDLTRGSEITVTLQNYRNKDPPIYVLSDGFADVKRFHEQGNWYLSPSRSLLSRRIFKPLPPKAEALKLIYTFFQTFNQIFPVFDQDSFLRLVEYSETDFNDPAKWACINVILALAHRFDALKSSDNVSEDRKAWGYFQNALSVSTELSMLHSNLAAVQALLGMAIIIQGTPNTTPFSSLLSATMKLAHSMDFHRRQTPPGFSLADNELRKQVFWTAYFLDKDLSIRNSQPPNQDDDEMDVELPFQDVTRSRWAGSSDGLRAYLARIELAKIQGQVYKRLGSVKSARQSVLERAKAVRELNAALHQWTSIVPLDFEGEYFIPTVEMPDISPIMHTITLRLTYFKTLKTIHSLTTPTQEELGGQWNSKATSGIDTSPIPLSFVDEARKAIKLLHVTPREDYGCIWVVLHIFVSATTTILASIISNPSSPLASSDLILIQPMLRLMGALAKQRKSQEIVVMYSRCSELWEEATRVMGLGGQEMDVWDGDVDNLLGRNKVQHTGEKESLEDFIKRIERISQGDDDVSRFHSFGAESE